MPECCVQSASLGCPLRVSLKLRATGTTFAIPIFFFPVPTPFPLHQIELPVPQDLLSPYSFL